MDSNVYIDLLRANRDVVVTLFEWADSQDRNIATCGMIRLEVLRGVRSPKARRKLSAFMDVMTKVPSDSRLWSEAADLAWNLDRKGIVIPGADAVIAASARRIGAAVMTTDAHFDRIEGVRVIDLPDEWFGN